MAPLTVLSNNTGKKRSRSDEESEDDVTPADCLTNLPSALMEYLDSNYAQLLNAVKLPRNTTYEGFCGSSDALVAACRSKFESCTKRPYNTVAKYTKFKLMLKADLLCDAAVEASKLSPDVIDTDTLHFYCKAMEKRKKASSSPNKRYRSYNSSMMLSIVF